MISFFSRIYVSFTFLFLIIASTIIFVESVSHPFRTRSGEFCYDQTKDCGPSNWPETCLTGRRQSPIDIPISEQSRYSKTFFNFNEAYGQTHSSFFAINNGHSFVVQLDGGTNPSSSLGFKGGALKEKYNFGQLHFHWGQTDRLGSEHTLNSRRYPLELHIVHYKTKYSSLGNAADKINDPEALAVFSVLFQLSNEDNPSLQGIIEAARAPSSQQVHEDFVYFPLDLNVKGLLPEKLDFARYEGALTVPPCTENVVWTVFTQPVTISRSQLEVIRGIENEDGMLYSNIRPTQPRNGREIKFYRLSGIKKRIDMAMDEVSNSLQKFVDSAESLLLRMLRWWSSIENQFMDFIRRTSLINVFS